MENKASLKTIVTTASGKVIDDNKIESVEWTADGKVIDFNGHTIPIELLPEDESEVSSTVTVDSDEPISVSYEMVNVNPVDWYHFKSSNSIMYFPILEWMEYRSAVAEKQYILLCGAAVLALAGLAFSLFM